MTVVSNPTFRFRTLAGALFISALSIATSVAAQAPGEGGPVKRELCAELGYVCSLACESNARVACLLFHDSCLPFKVSSVALIS